MNFRGIFEITSNYVQDFYIFLNNHFLLKYIIFMLISSLLVFIIFKKKEGKKKLTEFLFYYCSSILLGLLINYLNNDKVQTFITNNKEIGVIIFLFITLIYIKERIYYTRALKQVRDNYFFALYFFALIISVVTTAVNANILWNMSLLITMLYFYFKPRQKIEEDKISQNNSNTKNSDLPITSYDDLFPTRKIECLRILSDINGLDSDNPFAIAINAEWGEGKTSFINGLQEKMVSETENKVYTIFVQPMILDNREKLLRYVFGQIETILTDNNIFTGKGSAYKKYFDLLLKFINNKQLTKLTGFFDVLPNEERLDLREFKINLEENIQRLISDNQRIYIIIDDLDRVEEQTIRETLTFIKEIVDLKGITVIFLVDYKKITSDNISINYLEKFINTKFDLKKVGFDELFDHYMNEIIPEYNEKVVIEEVKQLRQNYEGYLQKINDNIKSSLERINNLINDYGSDEKGDLKQKYEDKRVELQNQYNIYENKLTNARNVKKIVIGIKESLNYFDLNLSEVEANYLNFEAGQLIFKLSIFKVLYKEWLDEIIKIGDMKSFINESNNEFVKAYFRESDKELLIFQNDEILYNMKLKFYNSLLFSEGVSNEIHTEIKEEKQQIIDEIDSNEKLNEELFNYKDLTDYLYAINYLSGKSDENKNEERIRKFIDLTLKMANNNKIKLFNLFELIGDFKRNKLTEYPFYFEALDRFLSKTELEFQEEKEKNISIEHLRSLETPLVFKNINYVTLMIKLYYFQDDSYSSSSIKDAFENIHTIDHLNKLLVDITKIETIYDSKSPIENFEYLIDCIKKYITDKYKDNEILIRSLRYNYDHLKAFIKIINFKNEISNKIKTFPIKIENSFEIKEHMLSDKELEYEINKLHEFINKDLSKVDYGIFRFFHSLLNNIDKRSKMSNVNFETLKIVFNLLDDIYRNNNKVYDSTGWHYCLIVFAEIKSIQH